MPFRQTLTKVRVVTRYGTAEFLSLKEAQEIYPDLDPYRGSKTFTSAINDNDALCFESWEVHDALSGD